MTKLLIAALVLMNMVTMGFIFKDKLPTLDSLNLPEIKIPVIYKEARQETEEPKIVQKEAVRPKSAPSNIKVPDIDTDLSKVKSFAYYTAQVNPPVVASAKQQMIIVNEADPKSKLFTDYHVSLMKSTGKIVLAEISVGYAESYRWYWKPAWNSKQPSFIGEEFSRGQFFVDDWTNPEWVDAAQGMIDKAIEAGFDGVVLDGIEAYIDLGAALSQRDKMVSFVVGLSQYAKNKDPEFRIVVKNAEQLSDISRYRNAVDGVLKTDLTYSKVGPKNANDQIVKSIRELKQFNKPVFVLEFVTGSKWNDARQRATTNGFIAYQSPGRSPTTIN